MNADRFRKDIEALEDVTDTHRQEVIDLIAPYKFDLLNTVILPVLMRPFGNDNFRTPVYPYQVIGGEAIALYDTDLKKPALVSSPDIDIEIAPLVDLSYKPIPFWKPSTSSSKEFPFYEYTVGKSKYTAQVNEVYAMYMDYIAHGLRDTLNYAVRGPLAPLNAECIPRTKFDLNSQNLILTIDFSAHWSLIDK
jgi:hypothetical protein